MPQVPRFEVGDVPVSIPTANARRIVERLTAAGSDDAKTAAAKIEYAMRLDESTTVPLHESTTAVRLTIGEDAAVLTALEELRATGDFSEELARLERTLREKIQREG